MTKQFKIGDRVRCVDSGGGQSLKNGQEYEVESTRSRFVRVKGAPSEYFAWRFELVEQQPALCKFKQGDRVRCTNSDNYAYVKAGSEYSVVSVDAEGRRILLDLPRWEGEGYEYPAKHFELIPATPKCFRILRKGIQWGTTEYGSVEDAEAAIQKSAPIGEPFVIVELSTVKAVTVKRVLEAA